MLTENNLIPFSVLLTFFIKRMQRQEWKICPASEQHFSLPISPENSYVYKADFSSLKENNEKKKKAERYHTHGKKCRGMV